MWRGGFRQLTYLEILPQAGGFLAKLITSYHMRSRCVKKVGFGERSELEFQPYSLFDV